MSCISYEEDWIHIDDYEKEVTALEDEIHDLRLEIESRRDNEVFTLAEVILIRDKLLADVDTYKVIAALNKLIGYHDEEIRLAAIAKVNELEEA